VVGVAWRARLPGRCDAIGGCRWRHMAQDRAVAGACVPAVPFPRGEPGGRFCHGIGNVLWKGLGGVTDAKADDLGIRVLLLMRPATPGYLHMQWPVGRAHMGSKRDLAIRRQGLTSGKRYPACSLLKLAFLCTDTTPKGGARISRWCAKRGHNDRRTWCLYSTPHNRPRPPVDRLGVGKHIANTQHATSPGLPELTGGGVQRVHCVRHRDNTSSVARGSQLSLRLFPGACSPVYVASSRYTQQRTPVSRLACVVILALMRVPFRDHSGK
jgi:hypothetical protein